MLVLISENFFKRQQHFIQRINGRVRTLDLNYQDVHVLNNNMGELFKINSSKYNKLIVRLLKFNISKSSTQYRNFKGKEGYLVSDNDNRKHFCDEIWVIFKNNVPVTTMLLHSSETKNLSKLKSKIRTNNVFYNVNDLKKVL